MATSKTLGLAILVIILAVAIPAYYLLAQKPTTTTTATQATTPTAGTTPSPSTGALTTTTTQTATTPSQEYIVVRDLAGREVKVPVPAKRVVAAGPGALRLLVYLNVTDKIVGVEESEKRWGLVGRPYIMAHPELAELPVIGPGGPDRLPDPELLVSVKPDVIFVAHIDPKSAQDIQDKTGIPVVVLAYGELGGAFGKNLYDSLRLAGKILGAEKRAEDLIKYMESMIEDLRRRAVNATSPPVYVGAISFKGARGIESTMAYYLPFVLVNANNVASKLGTNTTSPILIDREKLLEWDPEIIFIDEGGLKLVLDDYRKNPDFYNRLSAVKNGKVYGLLPYNYYATNIETVFVDAYFVGKVLYPDRFSDIDPVKKADEIYTFFVGKPVYREMAEAFGGLGVVDLATATVKASAPTAP